MVFFPSLLASEWCMTGVSKILKCSKSLQWKISVELWKMSFFLISSGANSKKTPELINILQSNLFPFIYTTWSLLYDFLWSSTVLIPSTQIHYNKFWNTWRAWRDLGVTLSCPLGAMTGVPFLAALYRVFKSDAPLSSAIRL